MTNKRRETYSTLEAARIIEVPTVNLHMLIERGLFRPTVDTKGRGTKRRWTITDCLACRIGYEWRQRGVAIRAVDAMMRFIRSQPPDEIKTSPVVLLVGDQVTAHAESTRFRGGEPGFLVNLRPGLEVLERRAAEVVAGRKCRSTRREPSEAVA